VSEKVIMASGKCPRELHTQAIKETNFMT